MDRTYYIGENRDNEAEPYAALENASFVQIALALSEEDVLMGAAEGVRSSVNDLFTFYNAFLEAACEELSYAEDRIQSRQRSNPLKCVWQMW